MKPYDVFFYECFEEEIQALKRHTLPDYSFGYSAHTIQETDGSDLPAPIISIRTQSILPQPWGAVLKGILTRSTGFNHIHNYLQTIEQDLPCGYLPLYCNRAIAEQAMTLWMALLRKLPQQIQHFDTFNRDGLTGYECEEKKLLVVGVGHIGYEIIRIGRGLGMHVRGVDVVQLHNNVDYVPLEEGLKNADIIVCAMALTHDNEGFFDYDRLQQAKKGAIFINTARGELSPSIDLLKLIDEGHLGGVALDVYNHESELAVSLRNGTSTSNPDIQASLELSKRNNVIMTPHNAFNTHEAVYRKAAHSVQQIRHFFEYGTFLWSVPPLPE